MTSLMFGSRVLKRTGRVFKNGQVIITKISEDPADQFLRELRDLDIFQCQKCKSISLRKCNGGWLCLDCGTVT